MLVCTELLGEKRLQVPEIELHELRRVARDMGWPKQDLLKLCVCKQVTVMSGQCASYCC